MLKLMYCKDKCAFDLSNDHAALCKSSLSVSFISYDLTFQDCDTEFDENGRV